MLLEDGQTENHETNQHKANTAQAQHAHTRTHTHTHSHVRPVWLAPRV